tara:strand:- start:282 stop:638 length:357 start_codon:yes stop_codon:yes gene_type:complete
MITNLRPKFVAGQVLELSFYHKNLGGCKVLFSYEIPVAAYVEGREETGQDINGDYFFVSGWCQSVDYMPDGKTSPTTERHKRLWQSEDFCNYNMSVKDLTIVPQEYLNELIKGEGVAV